MFQAKGGLLLDFVGDPLFSFVCMYLMYVLELAVFLDILKTTHLNVCSSFSIHTGGLLLSKLTLGWTVLL